MKLFVALPNLHTSAYCSPRKHIRLHLSHAIAGWEDAETLSLVTSTSKKYIICLFVMKSWWQSSSQGSTGRLWLLPISGGLHLETFHHPRRWWQRLHGAVLPLQLRSFRSPPVTEMCWEMVISEIDHFLGIKHILSARGVSLKMRYSSQDLLEIRWILGADILNGILWGAPIFFWDSRFQLMVLRAEFYGDLTHFLGCWHVRGKSCLGELRLVEWWRGGKVLVGDFSVAAFHFFNN